MNNEKYQIEKLLKDAELNLKRIKETYREEPKLMNFYLPSAEFLVNEYRNTLSQFNKGDGDEC